MILKPVKYFHWVIPALKFRRSLWTSRKFRHSQSPDIQSDSISFFTSSISSISVFTPQSKGCPFAVRGPKWSFVCSFARSFQSVSPWLPIREFVSSLPCLTRIWIFKVAASEYPRLQIGHLCFLFAFECWIIWESNFDWLTVLWMVKINMNGRHKIRDLCTRTGRSCEHVIRWGLWADIFKFLDQSGSGDCLTTSTKLTDQPMCNKRPL